MLNYLGLTIGNFWLYDVYNFNIKTSTQADSVISIMNMPLYGFCFNINGKLVKIRSNNDSTFIWTGNNYYHNQRVIFAKFNPNINDSWQAWDTCFIMLNTKLPFLDIDGDSILDTIIFRPSIAKVESINPIFVKLHLHSKIILTGNYLDSINQTEVLTYSYIANFGLIRMFQDSLYQTYYKNSFTWTNKIPILSGKILSSISISEKIENKKLIKGTYDITGRKVNNTRRGIYIIDGKKVFK
jgi:hypothetical protein